MMVPTKLLLLMVFTVLVLWWHCLVLVQGHGACIGQHVRSSNVSTDLQSDVLLPCNFNLTLLGSATKSDVSAVWTYKNRTVDPLVEISLQKNVMFWNNRNRRIQAFFSLSTSGNFSILLKKVNQSDMGLYRCELYVGDNCSIAHQEVQLGLSTVSTGFYQTPIIAGTSGGAFVLLPIILVLYLRRKRRTPDRPINTQYDSVQHNQSREGITCDPPIYENCADLAQQSHSREGSDRPIYTQYTTLQHSKSTDDCVYENPIYTTGRFLDKPDSQRGDDM